MEFAKFGITSLHQGDSLTSVDVKDAYFVCTCLSCTSVISTLCHRAPALPVHDPALQPQVCTLGIHQGAGPISSPDVFSCHFHGEILVQPTVVGINGAGPFSNV